MAQAKECAAQGVDISADGLHRRNFPQKLITLICAESSADETTLERKTRELARVIAGSGVGPAVVERLTTPEVISQLITVFSDRK